jgi:hypothetical protein
MGLRPLCLTISDVISTSLSLDSSSSLRVELAGNNEKLRTKGAESSLALEKEASSKLKLESKLNILGSSAI